MATEPEDRSSRHLRHRNNLSQANFQTGFDAFRFNTPLPIPGPRRPHKVSAPRIKPPERVDSERMTSLQVWHRVCDDTVEGESLVWDMVPESPTSRWWAVDNEKHDRERASPAVWERRGPPKLTRVRQCMDVEEVSTVCAPAVTHTPVNAPIPQSSFVRSFMNDRPDNEAREVLREEADMAYERRRAEFDIVKAREEAAGAAAQAVRNAVAAAELEEERLRAEAIAKVEAEEEAERGGWEEEAFNAEVHVVDDDAYLRMGQTAAQLLATLRWYCYHGKWTVVREVMEDVCEQELKYVNTAVCYGCLCWVGKYYDFCEVHQHAWCLACSTQMKRSTCGDLTRWVIIKAAETSKVDDVLRGPPPQGQVRVWWAAELAYATFNKADLYPFAANYKIRQRLEKGKPVGNRVISKMARAGGMLLPPSCGHGGAGKLPSKLPGWVEVRPEDVRDNLPWEGMKVKKAAVREGEEGEEGEEGDKVDAVCGICKEDTDDESLLLCDGCDAASHMGCLPSPLVAVPEGDWFCAACHKATELQAARKRKQSATPSTKKEKDVVTIVEEESVGAVVCIICKEDADDASLLLCDGCDEASHMGCLPTRLYAVPKGDWFCAACDTQTKFKPACKRKRHNSAAPSTKKEKGMVAVKEVAVIVGEEGADAVVCRICKEDVDDASLLLCDGCDKASHMGCLPTRLYAVPKGDWFCAACDTQKQVKVGRKRKRRQSAAPSTAMEETAVEKEDEKEDESISDAIICSICKEDADDQSLLLCDGCDDASHMGCLPTRLYAVPKGDWFYAACEKNNAEHFQDELTDLKRNVLRSMCLQQGISVQCCRTKADYATRLRNKGKTHISVTTESGKSLPRSDIISNCGTSSRSRISSSTTTTTTTTTTSGTNRRRKERNPSCTIGTTTTTTTTTTNTATIANTTTITTTTNTTTPSIASVASVDSSFAVETLGSDSRDIDDAIAPDFFPIVKTAVGANGDDKADPERVLKRPRLLPHLAALSGRRTVSDDEDMDSAPEKPLCGGADAVVVFSDEEQEESTCSENTPPTACIDSPDSNANEESDSLDARPSTPGVVLTPSSWHVGSGNAGQHKQSLSRYHSPYFKSLELRA